MNKQNFRILYSKQSGSLTFKVFLSYNSYFFNIKFIAKCIGIDLKSFEKNDFNMLCTCFDDYFKLVCSITDINQRIPKMTISLFDPTKIVTLLPKPSF